MQHRATPEPMDSYMQALYQAFQHRDWDRFMSVSETAREELGKM